MSDLEPTIHEALQEVAAVRGLTLPEIKNGLTLTGDLGLKSLDMAHVVAILESRLQADPFARLVPITSVRTVGDLCEAYRRFFDESHEPMPAPAIAESEARARERRQAAAPAARARLREPAKDVQP